MFKRLFIRFLILFIRFVYQNNEPEICFLTKIILFYNLIAQFSINKY